MQRAKNLCKKVSIKTLKLTTRLKLFYDDDHFHTICPLRRPGQVSSGHWQVRHAGRSLIPAQCWETQVVPAIKIRLPTARSAATTGAESAGQPRGPYGGAALTRYRPVPDSRAKDERQRRRRLRHGKLGGLLRLGPRRAASKTAAIVCGATQGRVWKGWASAGGWSCAQVPSPRRESTAGPALFGPGAGPVHPAPASRPVSRAAAGSRKGERGGGGGV